MRSLWLLLCICGLAWAKPLTWQQVQQAQGGARLAQIKTYQETAQLVLSDKNVLTVVTKVDFKTHTIQVAYKDKNTLLRMVQYSSIAANNWQWDAQTGRAPLAPDNAREFKLGFERSWYGLMLSTGTITQAGNQSLRDIKGQAIDVKRSAQDRYIVDTRGVLLAENYGDTTLLYAKHTCVQPGSSLILPQMPCRDGVLIPFSARIYAGKQLLVVAKVLSASINPKLTAADFKVPKQ